jgi:DNA processing protein
VSFAPNLLIKQGAKLVTTWEDVIEELPTEIRAALFPVDDTTVEERTSLFVKDLSAGGKKIFGLLAADESIHVDEIVEKSELTSSEVLAALCEMEMQGMVRQMPGKQFIKVLQ